MITKPMRGDGVEDEDFEKLVYPIYGSPKLDGIRSVKLTKALSKTFKDIPNAHVQKLMKPLPSGLDGELMIKKSSFNGVQSGIMSKDGEPDFEYWVFDYVSSKLDKPFNKRLEELNALVLPTFCIKVPYRLLKNKEELIAYEEEMLALGYEGIMLRKPTGEYKCGKSSVRQGLLMKVKRFKDSECEVIGFEELMHNENEKTKDAFGNSVRSSHKENLVPAGTLGKFLVKETGDTPWKGRDFAIGTGKGLSQELRQEIWDNRKDYLGKTITYRYQNHGIKELPRIPIWHGFRHKDDISE